MTPARIALAIALLLHALLALWAARPVPLPDAPLPFPGASLTPHARDASPERGDAAGAARIDAAVAATAALAGRIRTYSVLEGQDRIPEAAARHGLPVALGVWVDRTETRTRAEIERAVALAQAHPNVDILVVGNETVLAETRRPADLVPLLREVRARTGRLVTTTEPWDVWLRMPEMADEVDLIGIHILPYWYGVAPKDAAAWAVARYRDVQAAFPGRRIWVAEYGWPSGRHGARATLEGQARAIREFAVLAAREGIEWNLVEAIDQPWKINEGHVGPNWGVLDVDLRPKTPLAGPVTPNARTTTRLALGPLLGLGLGALLLALARPRRRRAAYPLALLAQGAGWLAAGALTLPLVPYLPRGEAVAWGVGLPLMALLAAASLERLREAVLVRAEPAEPVQAADAGSLPVVSLHIAARGERPEVLRATLEAIAALDWPKDRLEAIVVLNNMPDGPEVAAARDDARRLGPFVRVIHVERLSGHKAGALNLALRETRPDADIIGILDADYAVDPRWLRRRVPDFADPKVALSQAPQAHRDGARSLAAAAMDAEADGFFDAGMVLRQRDQAIVTHGTMLLLRRRAVRDVGAWAEDQICEDTELGLRLQAAGWHTAYVPERLGHGLLPDDLDALGRQRWRWACGGIALLRRHVRLLLPGSPLTPRQRWHAVASGLHWAGEAATVAAAALAGAWGLWLALGLPGSPPHPPLAAQRHGAAHASWTHAAAIHGPRGGIRRVLLAGAAAAAAQLSAAQGALAGLLGRRHPFRVTPKGGVAATRALRLPEAWLAALLLVAAAGLSLDLWMDQTDRVLLTVALALQAIGPVLATLLRIAERHGMAAPATWRPAT
jgi:exo-beta-1,3-glucanase (GH17 family)